MVNMKVETYRTMKIWNSTRKLLKLLAAKKDKPMTEILDSLVKEAIEKLKQN